MRREDLDRLVDVFCPECDKPRQLKVSAFKGQMPDGDGPYSKICRSCKYKERTLSQETKDKIREKLAGKPKPTSVKAEIRRTRQSQFPAETERLAQFNAEFAHISSHEKITMKCDECPVVVEVAKTSALEKIKKTGAFRCRSCGSIAGWAANPMTEDHREKIRAGRLGRKHSSESRVQMSEAKKALFQTERGVELKRQLSEKAAKEHGTNLHENSRRKGIYPSLKNGRPMPFGSSYELKAILLVEEREDIRSYETQVHYEIDDRHRSMDLLVHFKDGKPLMVEIKPHKRLHEEAIELQIEDARRYAEAMGYDFGVWTETDIGFATPREATKWADEFMSTLADQDFVAVRKQMNRDKANRYYQKANRDQIEVYCDFCKENHTLRAEQYETNVAKNGRFICIKENGSLIGKRPKTHLKKENPYAAEGKKKCNGFCGMVKSFEEFWSDKTKSDGRATKCIECGRAAQNERYKNKKE